MTSGWTGRALVLAGLWGASLAGCQILSGLNDLSADAAAAGGGGAATGGGGTGGENPDACDNGAQDGNETDIDCGGPDCGGCEEGQSCGDHDDCADDLFCDQTAPGGPACNMLRGPGSPCVEPEECSSNFCTDDVCCDVMACGECEVCGDSGSCESAPAGTACGDDTSDTCTDPDTCDGSGNCQPNHTDDPCGSAFCMDGDYVGVGTCSDGSCDQSGTTDCVEYACDEAAGCLTECDDSSECAIDHYCLPPPPNMPSNPGTCEECGPVFSGGPAACDDAAGDCFQYGGTCNNDICEVDCTSNALCMGTAAVDTKDSNVVLLCDASECTNLTVQCNGPRRCDVVCNGSGCMDLTLNCANDNNGNGACKLTCMGGTSCTGSASVNCGQNECEADCGAGQTVTVTAGSNSQCPPTSNCN